MDLAVLGGGVGTTADTDRTRDVLDATALTSLSPAQFQQFHQAQQQQQQQQQHSSGIMDYDLSSSPMPVDGISRSGSGIGNNSSGAMELDDFSGLFGLGLGLDVGVGQPPLIQGSSTVMPGQLVSTLSGTSDQDLSLEASGLLPAVQGVQPMDLLEQYLSPSLSKPFGSFSDFQALALEGDYSLTGRPMGGRTASDIDVSLAQHSVNHQHPTGRPTTTVNSLGAYRSPNATGYPSDSSFGTSRGGHSASATSSSSYPPSSVELSVPSSLSPMVLHYDSRGRMLTDGSGSTSGVTEDNSIGDGLSFVLSGLMNSSGGNGSSPLGGTQRSGHVSGRSGGGVEPRLVMKRTPGFVRKPSRLGQGSRKGNGKGAQFSNVPIPLPVPTRSKKPALMGWQGEEQHSVSTSISPTQILPPQEVSSTPFSQVPQTESRKRKRSPEVESEDDWDEERKAANNMRREMLGLRTISRESGMKEEESSGEERERKRRRVGSWPIPLDKGKERETKVEWSDDDSEESDDSDAYYPSRSSSPANDNPGPSSSRPAKSISRLGSLSSSCSRSSRKRSETVTTSNTDTTSMSLNNHQDEKEKGSRKRKRNKGKARGSAALALAKVTMLSGKSPTSPWGTYVPFSLDEEEERDSNVSGDIAEVRAGRRRRNGHIPLPIPVPHLIKKSRGRKVPHLPKESKKRDGNDEKRMFVCEVPGCGKCFVRGEHLKRHVRSIHTYDKPHPCPYEGCDKSFSRRDNLGQHVRIHLPNGS